MEVLENDLDIKKDAINRFIEDKLKKRKLIYYVLLILGIFSLLSSVFFILLLEIFSNFFDYIGLDVNKTDHYLYLALIIPEIIFVLLLQFYRIKMINRESIEKYINEDLEYHEPNYITFFKICILSIIAIGMIILLIATITFIIKNVLF